MLERSWKLNDDFNKRDKLELVVSLSKTFDLYISLKDLTTLSVETPYRLFNDLIRLKFQRVPDVSSFSRCDEPEPFRPPFRHIATKRFLVCRNGKQLWRIGKQCLAF